MTVKLVGMSVTAREVGAFSATRLACATPRPDVPAACAAYSTASRSALTLTGEHALFGIGGRRWEVTSTRPA